MFILKKLKNAILILVALVPTLALAVEKGDQVHIRGMGERIGIVNEISTSKRFVTVTFEDGSKKLFWDNDVFSVLDTEHKRTEAIIQPDPSRNTLEEIVRTLDRWSNPLIAITLKDMVDFSWAFEKYAPRSTIEITELFLSLEKKRRDVLKFRGLVPDLDLGDYEELIYPDKWKSRREKDQARATCQSLENLVKNNDLDSEAIQKLVLALESESPRVRATAASLLRYNLNDEVIDLLVNSLKDSHIDVRQEAAFSLSNAYSKRPDIQRILEEAMQEGSIKVVPLTNDDARVPSRFSSVGPMYQFGELILSDALPKVAGIITNPFQDPTAGDLCASLGPGSRLPTVTEWQDLILPALSSMDGYSATRIPNMTNRNFWSSSEEYYPGIGTTYIAINGDTGSRLRYQPYYQTGKPEAKLSVRCITPVNNPEYQAYVQKMEQIETENKALLEQGLAKYTSSGALFKKMKDLEKSGIPGEVWKDPSGTVWYDIAKSGDGSVRLMNHEDALAFCRQHRLNLPEIDNYLRLKTWMGGEDYTSQILPNFEQELEWARMHSGVRHHKHSFNSITGSAPEEGTHRSELGAVRCVGRIATPSS